jgi:nitrogen-specific signal transduction histidine kinase
MATALLDMVRHAREQADPTKALAILLKDCVETTRASTGRIYLLRLQESAFKLACQEGRRDCPTHLDLAIFQKPELGKGPLTPAVLNRQVVGVGQIGTEPRSQSHSDSAASRLIVHISRERTCLGLIDLDSSEANHFTQEHQDFVEAAAATALLLIEKEDTLRLLNVLSEPPDFQQRYSCFLEDLAVLTAEAVGMPYILIYELVESDSLHCLSFCGMKRADVSSFHLDHVAQYPPLARAIQERKTQVERSLASERCQGLRDLQVFEDFLSLMAVPLQVGGRLEGVMLMGASCEFDYTDLDISICECAATMVGSAIANYRHIHDAGDRLFEEAKIGAAITSIEVAQAARHEAKNRLSSCQTWITVILNICLNPTKKDLVKLRDHVNVLSEELKDIDHCLQKIKNVTKPPEHELVSVDLRSMWEEAFGLVTGRLAAYHVDFNIRGKAEVQAYPDFLKHAFLNLILNSIDAFKDHGKKRNRSIVVAIEPAGEGTRDISMRYTDNAAGIDPSKLRPLHADGNLRSAVDIFEPGVTSKDEGSGYGMFLVRNILKKHHGSIDLVDYRNGVTFQLRLPRVRDRG